MNVLVIGANGQVGKQIASLLSESKVHSVRAAVRKKEQQEEFQKEGVDAVLFDLEDSVESLQEGMVGCDALVFTAGSGGKTGADKTLLVDLDGAVKSMEAAENVGIKRFVMISALQAHHRENWNPSMRPYYVAKHYADRMLTLSDLNFTIIRPGGLLNEPGTGKISVSENVERAKVPRQDVAKVAVACLDMENTFRRYFDLVSGDVPIEEALREL